MVHLKEAMKLNRERRELYRQDGNRDAAKIINKLLLLEKVMLPFSYSLDRSVKSLQQAGIGMWCDDLVSMDTVPDYQSNIPTPLNKYQEPNPVRLKKLTGMMKRYQVEDTNQLYQAIAEFIENDLSDHHYNCLTRHFLESAAKTLGATSARLGLAPSELKQELISVTRKLIKQLARSLRYAQNIDEKAGQVQERGVPVLCQEMPPIPW